MHAHTHIHTHACTHTHTHTHILRLVLPSLHRVKIPSAKQSAEFTGQKSGNARRRSRTAVASQQNPTPYPASGPDGPLGNRKLEIYWSKWANAMFTIWIELWRFELGWFHSTLHAYKCRAFHFVTVVTRLAVSQGKQNFIFVELFLGGSSV